MSVLSCQPGDVVAVRTGGWEAAWIRFGAAIRGLPNLDNHVVVAHHVDKAGTLWGIEGRPGGVGWVDMARYLKGPLSGYAVANWEQPKTTVQRQAVCQTMELILKMGYDWRAIVEDGLDDLHIPDPWQEKWKDGTVPGHVVCSSAAMVGYAKAGLPRPDPADPAHVQPGDWTEFTLNRAWT